MPKDKPEIRFAGYTDAWEKRKLESFSKTTHGGGTPKTNVAEFWEGNIPWIQSSNLTNDDVQHIEFEKFISIKGLKNSAAKLIPKNSIAIVTRVGVGKLALVRRPFATSQDFLSLTDLTVNSQFALYTIYNLLKKELNNIQGTSIKGITKKDLLSKNLLISLNFEEQEKVGMLFQSLDQLITVNQRKVDLLKELKKGFLQKMFPKNGEDKPEIRFGGYTDPWEKRRLRDISKISAGGDVNKDKLTKIGKYPVLANALTNDGIIGYYEDYKVKAPAVTVTGRGDVGHAKARHIGYTPTVRLLSVQSDDFDVNFLENSINHTKIFIESTGVPQLTSPQLGSVYITFPSLKEQTKIGTFLNSIDRLIVVNQRRVDLLKQEKKALLQKMFV